MRGVDDYNPPLPSFAPQQDLDNRLVIMLHKDDISGARHNDENQYIRPCVTRSCPQQHIHSHRAKQRLRQPQHSNFSTTSETISKTTALAFQPLTPTFFEYYHNTMVQDDNALEQGRAFHVASTLLSGILAISFSQALGAPLRLMDAKLYKEYMAWTKESFAVLMTSITQWWSPTIVKVSGDESMRGQLFQMPDGSLKCNFPHRLVLMANHQLYTDWLYLWWIAYTNKMHGHIYIIMKESLKQLPIIGWSGQLYNFIFLSRKWDTDEVRFRQALKHLCKPQDPMWLLIFPEGTNLSTTTREKSKAWADKSGISDMKHQLLPRAKGLQFSLQQLKSSTNWLYDCTVAYEGVPAGAYGQDIFTLKSSILEGKPPKSVNMHWRRYRISDIPVDNAEAFSRWLVNRWREKDYMLEYFGKNGHFPAGSSAEALPRLQGKLPRQHSKCIETQIKGEGWNEFLTIFEPITSLTDALSAIDMTEPLNIATVLQASTPLQPEAAASSTTAMTVNRLAREIRAQSIPPAIAKVRRTSRTPSTLSDSNTRLLEPIIVSSKPSRKTVASKPRNATTISL